MTINGSSPRVRGTPGHAHDLPARTRFIPARAGNTRRRTGTLCGPPVHPRACGEHDNADDAPALGSGSSPRVRGTHAGAPLLHPVHRFIPARAGNTIAVYLRIVRHPVHPRACGEHKVALSVAVVINGSSPRVRGTHKPGVPSVICEDYRFIPARAGNTHTLAYYLRR